MKNPGKIHYLELKEQYNSMIAENIFMLNK